MNYVIELEHRGIQVGQKDGRPVFARKDGRDMLPADMAYISQNRDRILEDWKNLPEFEVKDENTGDWRPMKFDYKTLLKRGYCMNCGERVDLDIWHDDTRYAYYRCEKCGFTGYGQIEWEKAE